jgi:large subunit ribosomal protein L31
MSNKNQPTLYQTKVVCSTCGTEFVVGLTKKEVKVDTCSNCHPFYSGKQTFVQATGQVEKFNKRYKVEKIVEKN